MLLCTLCMLCMLCFREVHLNSHLPLQDLAHKGSVFHGAQALPKKQVTILCQLLVPHCAPPRPLEQVPGGDEAMLASKHIAHLHTMAPLLSKGKDTRRMWLVA